MESMRWSSIAFVFSSNGIYNIILEVQNLGNSNICSCPSIGNGFVYGRHLTAWVKRYNSNIIIDYEYESKNNLKDGC